MNENRLEPYGGGPPCVAHSPTSVEASEAIAPRIGILHAALLRFLLERAEYGATDEEMQVACDMNPSTQRPRRCELVAMGKVKDSGMTRRTKSKRQAVVWVIA